MRRCCPALGTQRLGKAVRMLRPPCSARCTSAHADSQRLLSADQQHLHRSLYLGPAHKQAPEFEYVTLAFRTQPRSKRRRDPRRGSKPRAKNEDFTNEIFVAADASGYRTLEVVSGGWRVLSPPSPTAPHMVVNGTPNTAPLCVALQHSSGPPSLHSNAPPVAAGGPGKPVLLTPSSAAGGPGKPVLPTPSSAAGGPGKPVLPTRPSAPHASPHPVGVPPTPRRFTEPTTTTAVAASRHPSPAHSRRQRQPQAQPRPRTPPHPPRHPPTPPPPAAAAAAHELPLAASDRSQNTMTDGRIVNGDGDPDEEDDANRTPRTHQHRSTQLAAALEAAAVGVLRLPLRSLRDCRRLHAELMALPDPQMLLETCAVLVRHLGLTPPQVTHVLTLQPCVLRLPHAVLAARGAALAAELALPLPAVSRPYGMKNTYMKHVTRPYSNAAGANALAEVVVMAPDALLRRGGYSGTCISLSESLSLSEDAARELLCRVPQLLRHPPRFFQAAVSNLQLQLGLHRTAAAALAAAAPVLLAVSPGVLNANAMLLRRQLQLAPAQLAEVVSLAPELLARPHGALHAVVMRLTAVLTRSGPWRGQLPRLLASGRNTAVALSFSSERYERLEYLVETGRDGVMGFKDALSLEDAEFEDVFPEYPEWRRAAGR